MMALVRISNLTLLAGPWSYGALGARDAIAEGAGFDPGDMPSTEPNVAVTWADHDCALVPYTEMQAPLGLNQMYDPNARTFSVTPTSVVGTVPAVSTPLPVLIAPTDYKMARGFEDLLPVLLAKGVLTLADVPAPVLANVNERRAMRGESGLA